MATRIIREISKMTDFAGSPADDQALVFNGGTNKWEPKNRRFKHTQNVAASEWTVEHNLNCFPNVAVIDSANTEVIGDVEYIDTNTLKIKFNGPFSGKAYLS